MQGCASQVWLQTDIRPNGPDGPALTFVGDSDAHIVRGLIAILFALYSGKPAKEILVARSVRDIRPIGLARASHAAALERLALDGQPHPRGRWRRADGGVVEPTAKKASLAQSASRSSRVATVGSLFANPIVGFVQHGLTKTALRFGSAARGRRGLFAGALCAMPGNRSAVASNSPSAVGRN